MKSQAPLNTYTPHKIEATLNKLYTILHIINISSIIHYRLTTYKHTTHPKPCILLFSSELFLALYSLLSLAYSYNPVTRTVSLGSLPDNDMLPPVDVLIFTSDPNSEPCLHVMNTVVSALALDYPSEKISVYVSDDGGCDVTLEASRECYMFAKWWVRYCRKYKVVCICPRAYFGDCVYDYEYVDDVEYIRERKMIEEKYIDFEDHLRKAREKAQGNGNGLTASRDHSPIIQVIENNSDDAVANDHAETVDLPSLIYVAREKRPHHPHHFKAGAINALLRVSGIITNSPYILALDSDMYCNDPSSVRQSMCYHLDTRISTTLAFVQFPQKFHNVNLSNDIYDGQIRHVFTEKWLGIDGLDGPIASGTGFYMKREATFGDIHPREMDLSQLKQYYGLSNEFLKSLQENISHPIVNGKLSSTQLSEAKFLASSTYEQNTKWGELVGFRYASVVEDYFTSFTIHCRGWKSVLCNPARPAFLGTATINLNDAFIQATRWQTGFVDVAFSRFFPLFYGPFVKRLSLLQSMCYAYFAVQPLCCFPYWCLAVLPQFCLLLGIPLYPKATSPWFITFSLAFLSGLLKNLANVLVAGSSTKTWWNEERFWLMKGVTSSLYATIDCIMKKAGLKQANFTTTNKADNNEIIELYNNGKFDFRLSPKFLVPLAGLVIFNIISLIGGVLRVTILGQWSEFIGQISLSFFVILLGFPVIEGMVARTDDASIPAFVSLKSIVFAVGLFVVGSVFLIV